VSVITNKQTIQRIGIQSVVCFITLITTIALIDFGLHGIIASSLVGFIGSFSNLIDHKNKFHLSPLIYCASFAAIGLSLSSMTSIIILTLIIPNLFTLSQKRFLGFGGKLGSIAYISGLIVFFISKETGWF